jgi:hypothetical protein
MFLPFCKTVHFSLLWIFLLAPLCKYGQEAPFDMIRNSGNYYWGTGQGGNYQEARRNALAMLSEGIQVEVAHNFEAIVTEENGNLGEYVKSVVTTYSSAVLNYYETKVLNESANEMEVLVYIPKERLQEYYKELEQSIGDFIFNAGRAEKDVRIADLLRYYYWALALTRGHPENQSLRHDFGSGRPESVVRGLNDRINAVFSFLDVKVVAARSDENSNQKDLQLQFNYRGKPVQDLDYSWWAGDGYSALISARNGLGVAAVDKDAASLRLKIEYQYIHKAGFERDVQRMTESGSLPYFARAQFSIPVNIGEKPVATTARQKIIPVLESNDIEHYRHYETAVNDVVEAISTGDRQTAAQYFTADGWDMFLKLFSGGKVQVLQQPTDTLRLVQTGGEVMVRSVPMLFSYHNNRHQFVENVVFTFDDSQKISSLAFALSDIAISDIINKPVAFGTTEEKYFLIKFMENYKTAYALKRLDYIESIFADDALIIVGHVVERLRDVENPWLNNDIVRYNTYTRQQYMANLAGNFRRNEFINIRFEDNEVRKTERDNKVYGIQIAQHYYSSTYADKGYLFLMIDLNDTLNPKIYVRTWQPEKNPDGSIFGLEHFRF